MALQFTYPSAEGWATTLGGAIAGVTADQKAGFATSNLYASSSLNALGAIFESSAGVDPGAQLGAAAASLVNKAVAGVAEGVVGVVSDAVPAIAGMAQAIPFLGEVASMAIGLIDSAIGPEHTAAEMEEVRLAYLAKCRRATNPPIVGTGPMQKTEPADLFRDLYLGGTHYAAAGGNPHEWPAEAHGGRTLPVWAKSGQATEATLMMLLCGDAAIRWGMTPHAYAAYLGEARRRGAGGIPYDVRRSMWQMIWNIFQARRNPSAPLGSGIVGDNGRAMFPLLCQTLIDQFKKGNWNLETARYLADHYSGAKWRQVCLAPSGAAASKRCATFTPGCRIFGQPHDIGLRLLRMLRGYETCILEPQACGLPAISLPGSRIVASADILRRFASKVVVQPKSAIIAAFGQKAALKLAEHTMATQETTTKRRQGAAVAFAGASALAVAAAYRKA